MSTTNKIVDALLVLKIKAGSRKAMGLLVKRWHSKFCRHAYSYTKDMDAAKDVAQDSWKLVLKNIHKLQDEKSFGSWGLRIVTRVSLDRIRKEKRDHKHLKSHYDTLNTSSNSPYPLDDGSRLKNMREAITKLPEDQKTTLQLFYLDEFSLKQIGDIMNVPVGTVKSRLFKARESLKKILKNRNHET
ncbi:MAG: RNA polymerase sigma factor [Flavobacteriaceae bacterium]|nr:RNA polymerase sigma factor [Flavobacteriaceae bacterium]